MLALQPTTNDPAAPKSKRGTTIFMTALVDSGHLSRKNLPFNNFCTTDLRLTSQAFGREPNALPELCNCYAYSTIKAPDKGEVGGSSPPRPTIKIGSSPETWVTECTGSMGNTFGPKGFSSGSSTRVSRSKYPRS